MIESKIKRTWNRPLSRAAGPRLCRQSRATADRRRHERDGGSCNGDEAVRRSIEHAVMDASPLPKPPHPSLFERNLNVNFRPEE